MGLIESMKNLELAIFDWGMDATWVNVGSVGSGWMEHFDYIVRIKFDSLGFY